MSGAAITGIGCVTPIGLGFDQFSQRLRSGTSGVKSLRAFEASPYKCRVAAEVPEFEPLQYMDLREARSLPRVVQFAVAGARMAVDHAGLRSWPDASRVGVLLGTSVGPSAYNFEQFAIFIERGAKRMQPVFPANAHYGVVASECAIQLGVHGPVMSVSSACTSGADALGLAQAMVQNGMADIVLAGGTEAPICPLLFAAFDRLEMMSKRFNDDPSTASRPFAADRDGFVLGEGSAIFVVERMDHALERGAPILAELAGYAATCDAKSHFSQDEGGVDAERAVSMALAMASMSADDIDYVNAHGSATKQNDPFETTILHRALGDRAFEVPVSSSKSMLGHLLGASGAVEVAATIAGMNGGYFPPTINLGSPDPACDLDYVPNAARPGRIDAALSTSFGFGSRNAALVLKRGRVSADE